MKEGILEGDVKKFDLATVKQWLANEVTIRLPGWALALGGLLLLALVLD